MTYSVPMPSWYCGRCGSKMVGFVFADQCNKSFKEHFKECQGKSKEDEDDRDTTGA